MTSKKISKDTVITEFFGVGEKRAKLYNKIGINTVQNLLEYYPRDYIDYSMPISIQTAAINEPCVIKAVVTKKMPAAKIRQGLVLYKVVVQDDAELMTIVLYNNRFTYDALEMGEEYLFYGKMLGGFTRKEMNSPQFIRADSEHKIKPKYRLTDGLTSNMIITNMSYALENIGDDYYNDFLPSELRDFYDLCTYEYAVKNVHFPCDENACEKSKRRLAFDEMLFLQLGMILMKNRNRQVTTYKMSPQADALQEFYDALPFELTNAQKNAISDVMEDMCLDTPMNRLIQGDVGSGKTAVAAGAAIISYKNGFQTAMMAPTEILAIQHYKTLSELLSPLGINVCCLTGSIKAKERREIAEKIKNGYYNVVVGTHALISESTEFNSLGLVIMDEQHRFGVNQRTMLANKGNNPHKLVMSATPIPRTLALIIYGDLDISVLNELPKGRQVIETFAVTAKLKTRAYGFIKKQLDEGRQAYIICPMIEDGMSEMAAAKSYAESLQKGEFADYRIGLLHGKMSGAAKDTVMSEFKEHNIDLLVATTVVEVGVDVPNSTIILIENADQFGLSQLHQLRGRVGRGKYQSYCILIAGNVTEESRERLKIMTETSDGFKISEYDLKLRGAGDFFGERQHGLPKMKIADIAADRELLSQTGQAAKKLFKNSDDLSLYPELKQKIDIMFENNSENSMN